jgi:hypothetical protein
MTFSHVIYHFIVISLIGGDEGFGGVRIVIGFFTSISSAASELQPVINIAALL